MKGQVYKALSGFYYVEAAGQHYQTRARGQFRQKKCSPLVGDIVEFESTNQKEGVLTKILPRKNMLQRPLVANVDQVIIVMSVKEPQFSAQLLDRFLVQAESLGVEVVLYWTKWDLLDEAEQKELKQWQNVYQEIGYPVILGKKAEVAVDLFPHLAGKLSVLMGQSGVGKSTLLNLLDPKQERETAEISQALGRGRHTTRHTELWALHGGYIVDTPGFSALDLSLTAEDLAQNFKEFADYAPTCKFRSCSHLHEPQCGVKAAVAAEKIAPTRYAHYQLFQEELAQQRPNYQKKKKERGK